MVKKSGGRGRGGETLRVGSKKMKSEHDRNRHARSRSKQPRNTIFLQGGTERESGPRRSGQGEGSHDRVGD